MKNKSEKNSLKDDFQEEEPQEIVRLVHEVKQNGKKKCSSKRKRLRGLKCVFIIVFALFALVICTLIAFGIYRQKGRNSLLDHARQAAANQTALMAQYAAGQSTRPKEETQELEEGQIAYQGTVYEYNRDLMTFLCLGVDSRQDIQKEKIPGKGGQADTILLVVVDTRARTLKMLNISRDTMTKVQIYDTNGFYLHEEETQLALQYAYGDGRGTSCELMEQAVSNLFYGIPIHGYGAIDVKAVAQLNDAVGGVEVTVIEDLSRFSEALALGNTVTLSGRQALHYVQERDVETEELGANSLRIERQKQYLMAFFSKVKEETKKDITLPLTLYNEAARHMVTSINAEQAAYLSTIVLDCTFEEEDMITVQGSIRKNDIYEEFIVDEQALYDLIIDVFYREVPDSP